MKTTRPQTTRRGFLQQTGQALTAAAVGMGFPTIVPRSVLGGANETPPSERILVGCIGVGNQGQGNLGKFVKHTIAVCEVDSDRLGAAKARVEKSNSQTCAAYDDYRRLLDNKDVDAVVITTPDHWHALMTIDACAAGKDVYCEKPLTLTIAEGQAMVQAARRHNRIVQTGSQQRSDPRFRLACELVRSGRFGKIHSVRAAIPRVNFKGPPVADGAAPPELDYDRWLGPAPQRPYNVNRVHYNFRFFWDYSGGQMTNWGAHNLDIAQWGLGMDESGPVSVTGRARYHKDRWFEVPEWCDLVYEYASGVKVLCGQEHGGTTFDGLNGTMFIGDQGSIIVNRKMIQADPPELAQQPLRSNDVHLYESDNHHANWLDCIKTRMLPICDVAIGHRSATVCHLGNIAIRTGRKITWDPAQEQIVGDPEAAAMASRPYRAPWKLPVS